MRIPMLLGFAVLSPTTRASSSCRCPNRWRDRLAAYRENGAARRRFTLPPAIPRRRAFDAARGLGAPAVAQIPARAAACQERHG